MTPGLGIRVALFLFLRGMFNMYGYAKPPSLVQSLQLPEHKRSSTESFIFDSAANLKLAQKKERDSRIGIILNQTERKTDRSIERKEPQHRNTMLKSKVVEDGAECQQRKVATSADYDVYHIQKGIMTKKLDSSDLDSPSGFSIEGLDKVARYKNTDVALEFSFKRPLVMSAIGFRTTSNNESGRRNDGLSVKMATIYVEKQREKNSWSPILNDDTKNVRLFKISSKLLYSLPLLNDALSGIRLYPQQWFSSPTTIGRPIFIYCASNP